MGLECLKSNFDQKKQQFNFCLSDLKFATVKMSNVSHKISKTK